MAPPPVLCNAIAALLKAEGPMRYHTIAERLGRAKPTIVACIRAANKRQRMFRIAEWERDNGDLGNLRPLIGLGSSADRLPPPAKSHNQSAKEYADRNRLIIRLKARAVRGYKVNPWSQLLNGSRTR